MEGINKIIDNLKNQKLPDIDISKKYTEVCIVCKKEFEYQATPEEIKRFSFPWDSPDRRFFCSDKCRDIHKEEKYKERVYKHLPSKFLNIKCDRMDLVKQGISLSLFIGGEVGVGKTVLLAGIAKEILKDQRRYVRWISYPSFIMKLQNMFKHNFNDEETPYDYAKDVASFDGALCIDDLGAEKITDFVKQITYYIINYREQEMLHTLITSNFSLQQIGNQIDTRVSSRIGGMCKIIKLSGNDRRLENKEGSHA